MNKKFKAFILFAFLMTQIAQNSARASLLDEIQVYTDDINQPGEVGMEVHINTTPKGLTEPSYSGEVVNHRGLRVTPEISYGLTPTMDVGLYIPTVRSEDGNFYAAGAKLRFKWLPVQPHTHGGWFSGVNLELGQIKQKFSESPRAMEVRTILGWKNDTWLLAVNPIFGWDLSTGYTHGSPDFTLASKVARKTSDAVALGFEYYNGRGYLNNVLPGNQQEKSLFIVMDYEGKPFNFNFGIGKGLTAVTDVWTVKAIVDYPF
jgi:hypothetical protein